MLFILFQLGGDHFALDAMQVKEALPLVALTRIPGATPGIAGIFSYHGVTVPVLDLCEMTLGRPSLKRLNTRVLLVNFLGQDGDVHLLGLIAEKATDTMRCEPGDFNDSGVTTQGAPYLGLVVAYRGRLIQWVDASKLLAPEVAKALFQPLQNVV